MRPERNPLDLNNFPEDYTRDGKQILEDSSSSAGYRKKKSGGKDGKDESGKVYECRFCSLKFCKSQALGGHMNRHRQERETETLNRARQIVFSNDNLIPQAPPHHLSGQPIPHGGGYHQTGNINDPFRSVYPSRLFSGSSSTMLPPPPPPPPPSAQSYMYSSPSRHMYPPHQMNDYFVGHVISGNTQYGPPDTNYTCVGAPVGHGYGSGNGNKRGLDMAVSGGRDMSLHSQDEGLNRGRNYTTVMQQRLDPSLINRYQDGF